MSTKPITIAGIRYPTLGAARTRISEIRHSGGNLTTITGTADVEIISELFGALPYNKTLLAGREIVGWGREWGGALCFVALLNDGSSLKFDSAKCLRAVRALQLNV